MRYSVAILVIFTLAFSGCAGSSVSPIDNPIDKNKVSGLNDLNWSMTSQLILSTDLREQIVEESGDYAWFPSVTEPYDVTVEEIFIPSTNGNLLFVRIYKPDWASVEYPCHGLVLVPGGVQKGSVWHAPWRRAGSIHWAKSGFAVVEFDFQGRGQSEGIENRGGPQGREDLRAIINYMNGRADVLDGGVGLVSSSMGCVPCAGALAVWTDLPVKFWIDLEGAHNRYSATQWDDPFWTGLNGGHGTDDNLYWSEREAISFQPFITVPYIRVQSYLDHSFDYFYVDHALEMVNAAVNGASGYARMNYNEPNIIFDKGIAESYQYENVYHVDRELYFQVIQASLEEF